METEGIGTDFFTSRFDHGLQGEVDRFHAGSAALLPPRIGPELFQEVGIRRVIQVMDEQMGYRPKSGSREKGIIVLVGNANLILNNLKYLKPDKIELSAD